MRWTALIVCACLVGCGQTPSIPPTTPATPAEISPPIEQTPKLQDLSVNFSAWSLASETSLVGTVEPSKQDLELVSSYHGRSLSATFYDTQGVKVSGRNPIIPAILKPGEKGRITLPLPLPASQISRIVLDVK